LKFLALDYGSARTGVAVSDPTGTVARPVTTVERAATDAGFAKLLAVIEAEEPEVVVVGLPMTLRGEHAEPARADAPPRHPPGRRPRLRRHHAGPALDHAR